MTDDHFLPPPFKYIQFQVISQQTMLSSQVDPDQKKLNEVGSMLSKLSLIINRDSQILQKLNQTTANQNEQNISTLSSLISKNQQSMADVLPQLQHFQEQVAFLQQQPPLPQPITTDKTGFMEHGVIEQMQRINNGHRLRNNYPGFNKKISVTMCTINKNLQECIAYANSKL